LYGADQLRIAERVVRGGQGHDLSLRFRGSVKELGYLSNDTSSEA